MTINNLIILLSLDDNSKREIIIPPFYKDFEFKNVYVIGRFAKQIENIKLLSIKPQYISADSSKIFNFNKNFNESIENDYYQAPYSKTTEKIDLEKNSINFYYTEPNSWYSKLPFKYQVASIVKPKNFPFYINETKIESFNDFEIELFYEGLDIIKIYIMAGFHIFQNTQNVPGWSVSPNTSWISLLMSLYNVFPITPDMMTYQEFISFARVRATLFYLSVNEFKKRFEDDEDNSISEVLTDDERIFFDTLLDKNIKKNILDNDEVVFKKWTDIEFYNKISLE